MTELPSDISEMAKRIEDAKKEAVPGVKKHSHIQDAIANAFRIGTEFIASVLIGLCMGFVLDKIFGTKVVFILVFSLFGCMAGMLNVYRSATEMDKNINKEQD